MARTIRLLVLLSLLLPFSTVAQDTISWKKHRFQDPDFQVRFPASYFESRIPDSTGRVRKTEIISELTDLICVVSVSTLEEKSAPEQKHYHTRLALESFANDFGLETINRIAYKQNGIDGMEGEFMMSQGGYKVFARFFIDGDMQYTIYVLVLSPDADMALKDKFFRSFRLK